MKKILIFSCLALSFFIYPYGTIHASTTDEGEKIKVTVTEKVPGADCQCEDEQADGSCPSSKYVCHVEKGFGPVVKMLGSIIKYFTFIAGLAGVLYLIINGIMYSMGGMDSGMKDEAKKRITATIIGLILLFMSGVILNIIAPWIYV